MIIRNLTSRGCPFVFGNGDGPNVVNEVHGGLVEDAEFVVGGKRHILRFNTILSTAAGVVINKEGGDGPLPVRQHRGGKGRGHHRPLERRPQGDRPGVGRL